MFLLLLLPLLKVVYATILCTNDDCGCCPDLKTNNFPYAAITQQQYRKFVTNTSCYVGVDSICTTGFNLPGGDYLVFTNIVYCDGSSKVETSVRSPVSYGIAKAASPETTQLLYSLGTTSCGDYIGYICDECGQENERYGVGAGATYGRISNRCLVEGTKILASQNLYNGQLYIFPMRLPPRCYYPPSC